MSPLVWNLRLLQGSTCQNLCRNYQKDHVSCSAWKLRSCDKSLGINSGCRFKRDSNKWPGVVQNISWTWNRNDVEMNYDRVHSINSDWGCTVCGPRLGNLVTGFTICWKQMSTWVNGLERTRPGVRGHNVPVHTPSTPEIGVKWTPQEDTCYLFFSFFKCQIAIRLF